MKLDAYIRESGMTEDQIAEGTGYSQGTINRLRNGKMNATLEVLKAIHRFTNGAVTPNDFLPEPSAEPSGESSPFTEAAQ
jgi:transcriptional regulator with XRE-family HTH domain